MTNIEDILAKLNKKTADAFIIASESENRLLPTPSLKLTQAIGGYGYGRISVFWGNRSAGKTGHLLQTVGNAQRLGDGVAWIDAEKNFDKSWARRMNMDPDKMILSQNIMSIADMADASHDLIKSGVDVLVIDSISALLPESYFSDKGEQKGLADTGQIGAFSKNIGAALNIINSVNRNTAVLLVSQVRTGNIGSGGIPNVMGGRALEHMASTTLKVWSNPNIKEAYMGDIQDGDRIVRRPVGRPVTWTVEKNRGPGMNESESYDFYFRGDFVGIDIVGEIVDVGSDLGIIKKSGNWYSVGDMKAINGRPGFIDYVRANPDLKDKLYGEILDKSI